MPSRSIRCAAPLQAQAQAPRGTQVRVPVRVSCTQGAAWSLIVPVEIHRELDVLVLRRPVARGETLSGADVIVQKKVIAGLGSPFVASVDDFKGRLTRRNQGPRK